MRIFVDVVAMTHVARTGGKGKTEGPLWVEMRVRKGVCAVCVSGVGCVLCRGRVRPCVWWESLSEEDVGSFL